jgi:hypothetical protein
MTLHPWRNHLIKIKIGLTNQTNPLMMKRIATTIFFCFLIGATPAAAGENPEVRDTSSNSDNAWQQLSVGLELGIFRSPQLSEIGDSTIRVLRIDTDHFKLRLLNASVSKNGSSLSTKDWCLQNGLVAAINASMFQADYKSSVSLMRTRAHVNNPRLSKDMTILAFDRRSSDVPRAKIIDRQCDDFNTWKSKYETFIQSIRMISCTGKNVWRPQPQKWSTAAIGIDHRNRVMFIHVGSPYSTFDLINILQALPLDIARAMYVEGGPQAQLYINIGDHEYEFVGGYKIDLKENMNSFFPRPIPNAVGISLRGKK